MRKIYGGAAALILTLGAVGACSGGSSNEWGAGEAFSITGALEQLPMIDGDGPISFQTGDLVATTEAAGLERPTSLAGEDLAGWLGPLTGLPRPEGGYAPSFVPIANLFNHTQIRGHEEFAEELGWSLVDVGAFVEFYEPPRTFAVLAGDFDDVSPEPDDVDVDTGVYTFGEGEDFTFNAATATVARPTGAPLHQGARGDLLAVAPMKPALEQWVPGTETGTMADRQDLAAVAQILDEAEALSAILLTDVELAGLTPATIGIGWAVADDAAVLTYAHHFASAEAAEAGADLLTERFSSGETMGGEAVSEILSLAGTEQHENVVAITLSLPSETSPGTIVNLLMRGDGPFAR